ncbi:MAG: EamA family transporter [Verrucomicrobia bacterium]|nr:EamA family transporter [Verrucomicrobiota bacterium]
MHRTTHQPPPRSLVIAAFAAVYIIWGATYLAIRYAVETIPPFLMGGTRFLLAGAIFYVGLRLTGTPTPAAIHWKHAAIAGALLLGIGNGGLNWAQQRVPSSVAALIIAVTPLWFALLEWLRPKGTRPNVQTILGILVGFCGMMLLVGGRHGAHHGMIDPAGVCALLLASLFWAGGSLYIRYTPKPDSALMSVALQMITGGAVLTVLGLLAGETARFNILQISPRSTAGYLFLVFVGSMLGFTSYSWLLKVSTPARLSTYAYVNPVVAVFLGWSIGGETLTPRMLVAAAVVVMGVVVITTPNLFSSKLASEPVTGKSPVLPECQ